MKRLLQKIIVTLTPTEKRKFRLLIILNTLISLADIISLSLLVYIINFYTNKSSVVQFDFLNKEFERNSIIPVALLLFIFIIKNLAAYLINGSQNRFVYAVATRLAHDNLIKFLEGNYVDYVNTDVAVQMRKISQQPVEYAHYLLRGLQNMITELVIILFATSAILLFNAKIFLSLLIILLPPIVLVGFVSRKKLRIVRKNIQSSGEYAYQYLQEALSGYIESCMYGTKTFFAERYTAKQSELNDHAARLQVVQDLPSRILEIFAVFGFFLLILIMREFNNSSILDIATIGAFTAAAYKIIPGVVKVFNITAQMKTFEYTLPGQDTLLIETNKIEPADTIYSVAFKSVSFYYNSEAFLENFNLYARQGQIIGIAGKSGKGKTTAINLLLGFLEPEEGKIFFNDKWIDAAARKRNWKNIAYVKQQTFLLHESILNNIILDDFNYNRQRLDNAIKLSGLDEIIDSFSEGLQKIITENGKNISGGQRQRIALARALYKNADLYIFDEAFSMLDDASMIDIMNSLRTLASQEKIILLVSHNEKNLSLCDKIVSLNE